MIPGDTQFLHAGSVTSDVASEILGFLKLADGQGVMHHVQAKALALVLTSLLSKQDEFTTMGADSDEFKQWMASFLMTLRRQKKSNHHILHAWLTVNRVEFLASTNWVQFCEIDATIPPTSAPAAIMMSPAPSTRTPSPSHIEGSSSGCVVGGQETTDKTEDDAFETVRCDTCKSRKKGLGVCLKGASEGCTGPVLRRVETRFKQLTNARRVSLPGMYAYIPCLLLCSCLHLPPI